ncbi:hypothetical protein FGO68_gene12425 [Halteria grandinella]|uniref:Uncharacterized protein n=1 Tax=Halteria grandinella TaxID=5974 RepID=A0A8J8NUG8_HALGN|nr:hypothetical protein FGO68_gene12425 [Halteria grandinella]
MKGKLRGQQNCKSRAILSFFENNQHTPLYSVMNHCEETYLIFVIYICIIKYREKYSIYQLCAYYTLLQKQPITSQFISV